MIKTKSHYIQCYNETGHNPSIVFNRQKIIVDGDSFGVMPDPVSPCRIELTAENALTEIPVLDPATDKPTGEVMTFLNFQQRMYSVYRYAEALQAQERVMPDILIKADNV